MNFASYGWIIDVDHLAPLDQDPTVNRAGTVGPRNIRPVINARLLANDLAADVKQWRVKDDDGELYYSGRYIGTADDDGFGPLEDFAQPDAGATTIEYLNPATGQWEAL